MERFAVMGAVFSLALGLHFAVDAGRSVGDIPKDARLEKMEYLTSLMNLFRTVDRTNTVEDYVEETVLLGLISNQINKDSNPRDRKVIRRYKVEELEQGDCFGLQLIVDSLSGGLECFEVEIAADFNQMTVSVLRWESRDVEECVPGVRGRDDVGINNGSKGIPELLDLALKTPCRKNILDECERGTVAMDTWTNETLAFQRWLARNTSVSRSQLLGTHNSFNNKADGYGTGDFTLGRLLEWASGGKWEFVWAQQWFTMTDQLNMGVRHLMLDPVYFWGAMRLCHCGTTFKWVDDVIKFLEKAFNTTFQFDSRDLGCMPYDRTFEAGIQEIFDWTSLPSHKQEFLMVLVNDEGHSADWGHLDLIKKPIREIMGDILFTPADKEKYFPDTWPTPNQLYQLGKHVMVTCSEETCSDDYIFHDMTIPAWDRDTMKYFTPFPECGGYGAGDWYIVGGESQVVGPIYNGPAAEGLVIQENLPYLLQCPVSIPSMDIASPGLLGAAVWSWADGFSVDNISSNQCVAMDTGLKGRWVTVPCSTSLRHACRNTSDSSDVELGTKPAAWNQPQCPRGFSFFHPATGYSNWDLYQVVLKAGVAQVWLNLSPEER